MPLRKGDGSLISGHVPIRQTLKRDGALPEAPALKHRWVSGEGACVSLAWKVREPVCRRPRAASGAGGALQPTAGREEDLAQAASGQCVLLHLPSGLVRGFPPEPPNRNLTGLTSRVQGPERGAQLSQTAGGPPGRCVHGHLSDSGEVCELSCDLTLVPSSV